MSHLLETEKINVPEFRWGSKRAKGGKNKEVQFYGSFTYDGMDYALYDSVYMYNEKEPEPYIGKLVKIWETADRSKKVKVHWFFRPSEISYYLKDEDVLENELFLASGAGNGLCYINPLESIAGKCNVVCISKDPRNPQPTTEELEMADYVFYRIFDVARCIISDQMGDSVGGLEVNAVFNKRVHIRCVTSIDAPVLVSNQVLKIAKPDKSGNCMLEEKDGNGQQELVKLEILHVQSSHIGDSSEIRETMDRTIPESQFDKDVNEPGQAKATELNKSISNRSMMVVGVDSSERKPNRRVDACHEHKTTDMVNDSSLMGGALKRAKFDDHGEISEDNKNMLKERNPSSWNTNRQLVVSSDANSEKSGLDNGTIEKFNDNNVANWKDDGKAGCKIFKVTRGPVVERRNWIKLSWEDRIMAAQDEGKLVLLQNLDPRYTSGEVEDIIRHALEESCTAKVVPHTAMSNPDSGQAFAIFDTREAVNSVVKRLEDRCLILPNQRPLLARAGVHCEFSENKKAFYGHLTIDKARRQTQKDMKEAVSTSHYSQSNTIEYDMAMSWCLLQSKFDECRKKLYLEQREDLKRLPKLEKIKEDLKLKK